MADRKISDLTALTAPASGDYLPIVDISEAAAANKNKRITIEELFRGVPLGTAAAPSIAIEGDENTGIYSPGADQLAISTGGSGRLFVDASGNVGISAAPDVRFALGDFTSNEAIRIRQTANGYGTIYFANGSSGANLYQGFIEYGAGTAGDFMRFGTAQNERLRITSAGLVGVGTSVPTALLSVGNASSHSIGLSSSASFYGAGSQINSSESTVGVFSTETAAVDVGAVFAFGGRTGNAAPVYPFAFIQGAKASATAGDYSGYLRFLTVPANGGIPVERLRISETGNVGIGTTSPGQNITVQSSASGTAPTFKLQNPVDSNSSQGAANNLSAGQLLFGATGSFPLTAKIESVYNADASYGRSAKLIFSGANGNGTLTERLTIDESGRVGIGSTTPGALVDASASSGTRIRSTYTSTGGSRDAGFEIYGDGAANSSFIYAGNTGITTISSLLGTALNIGGNEALRVDSSRRLLVGTSSTSGNIADNDKLAVVITGDSTQGGISVTDYAGTSYTIGSSAALRLQRSIGTTDGSFTALTGSEWGLGRIEFNGSNGVGFGTGATIEGIADSLAWSNGDHPAKLVFSTTADGASSPTERMRITNDGQTYFGITGNTGLGTTNRGFLIRNEIAGKTYVQLASTGTTTDTVFYFYNGNGLVGSISMNGSATAYNTSSDYRLKENVAPVPDGIARLQQLKPSRFNFIADPATTVDGFIAHEVQAVVPEAITGEKDAVDDDGNPIYQGIDQSKLVPLLTAALQEAVAKIESLEARLTAAGI